MSTYAVELMRQQFGSLHNWLEGTMKDVTPEQAHWQPDGKPNPIGAQYIHVVAGEDGFIGGLLAGKVPLRAGEYEGKTGASELPPRGESWENWARSVTIDLDAARAYAQAVYQSTDDYLATLSDGELMAEVDLSAIGMGKMTRANALTIMLLNGFSHSGEISALKGMQGAVGYPF